MEKPQPCIQNCWKNKTLKAHKQSTTLRISLNKRSLWNFLLYPIFSSVQDTAEIKTVIFKV